MDCAELRAADKAPGWCTHCNCTADAAQPVLEGQLYRFFPLPNRSFDGGRMSWEEHNVAPFAGDAAFGCIDNAYADWLAGRNTLISVGDFRWSTAYGQYAWCEDAEPGSCHYSGGGARVGNVNPFGPWTHKGATPTAKRSTDFPSHSCNLTTGQSTCPSCPTPAVPQRGQLNRWYNLTAVQKLELTQQCNTNITTGAWFSLEAAGKCEPGRHVEVAHPPSDRPGGGCAWEWLPAAGVQTIEVACLNQTGYFSACADAQLVTGRGCAYTQAAALFRKAIATCPNVTAKLNLRYKADDTANTGSPAILGALLLAALLVAPVADGADPDLGLRDLPIESSTPPVYLDGGFRWTASTHPPAAAPSANTARARVQPAAERVVSANCSAWRAWQSDTDYHDGQGIGHAPGNGPGDCCTQCASAEWAVKGCKFFTWAGGGAAPSCWFKADNHNPIRSVGAISGGISPPPGPPPPPPPPAPPITLSVKGNVPGDLVTDLQKAGVIADPYLDLTWLKNSSLWTDHVWTYSTNFSVSPPGNTSSLLLVFDGAKMGATVSPILSYNNYLEFSCGLPSCVLTVDPPGAYNLKFTRALIGIFSQTAGPTCEFWVNPVNSTFLLPWLLGTGQRPRRGHAARPVSPLLLRPRRHPAGRQELALARR
jgi:hypothetical protein